MKQIRKNKGMDEYRENHLTQMKKKIVKELFHDEAKKASRMTLLQFLAKGEKGRGTK